MRLTDSTIVRQLGNGRIVVTEGTAPAVFVSATEVFECGDFYEGYPAFTMSPDYEGDWYPDSPSDLIQSCTAMRVGFENGSACVAGHVHFTDAEYYTEEEMRGTVNAGYALAPNARMI